MQRHYVMVSKLASDNRFTRKWQSHSRVWLKSRILPQKCSGSLCPPRNAERDKKGSARNVPEIYGNVEIFSPESSHLCRTHRCLYHGNFSPCRFFCNIISSWRLYLNTWWLFNNHIFSISSRLHCSSFFFAAAPWIASWGGWTRAPRNWCTPSILARSHRCLVMQSCRIFTSRCCFCKLSRDGRLKWKEKMMLKDYQSFCGGGRGGEMQKREKNAVLMFSVCKYGIMRAKIS